MLIIPAIDLKDGKCVQLQQGLLDPGRICAGRRGTGNEQEGDSGAHPRA